MSNTETKSNIPSPESIQNLTGIIDTRQYEREKQTTHNLMKNGLLIGAGGLVALGIGSMLILSSPTWGAGLIIGGAGALATGVGIDSLYLGVLHRLAIHRPS